MPEFMYDGAQLCYFEYDERQDKSQGFPIVFVHGAGSSHNIWKLQVREFKKTHRVITFDLSGHGCSERTVDNVSIMNDYARELEALIKHLSLEDFVLIGHSMGGGVVMSYVLNGSSPQPRAIVLVDTSADLDLTKLAPGIAIEFVQEMFFRLESKLKHKNSEALEIIEAEQKMKEANPEMMTRDLKACHEFDIRNRLKEIKVPTLVIHGIDDDVIRPGYAQELERAIPRADLVLIRDANHQPMIEKSERFNAILTEFLQWLSRTLK